MIRLLALAAVLISIPCAQSAPGLTGLWLTEDKRGVIAISPCGGNLCARIVGFFLDRPDEPTPTDYRGVSQCNLPMITGARQIQPGLWKGHITDPRNGDVWGVELHLDNRGNLALRGFLAIPLLGHTETWTRYPGKPPPNCRIASPGAEIGQNRALPNEPEPSR
jgi:uncharacterized protein (DUF2147 family)